MLRYTLKRLGYAVLTLFVLITLTFFMMRMLPGDPFLGDKTVTGAALENMKAKYGLDKPVIVQYFIYLGNCVRGDLGTSIDLCGYRRSASGYGGGCEERQRMGFCVHVYCHDRRVGSQFYHGRVVSVFSGSSAEESTGICFVPCSGLGRFFKNDSSFFCSGAGVSGHGFQAYAYQYAGRTESGLH